MNHNKIIHLTCKDKNNIDNKIWNESLKGYKDIYKDYEIKIYDNEDIYKIVEKHYPKYLRNIKKIKIGAVLADIFRYLILYLEGGIYSDFDCMPINNKHIKNLFNETYYHGNPNSNDGLIYIYDNLPKNKVLKQESFCDYHINPCDNSTFIKQNNDHKVFKCNGHKINKNIKTVVCYEFIKYNQICQWFIISEAKQKVFLQCFIQCMKNINILKNLDKKNINYNDIVMKNSGPELFSKYIHIYKKKNNNILILPETFFCTGSGNYVPTTKYSYVKHYFTSSWR